MKIAERIALWTAIAVLLVCGGMWRKAYNDEQAKYRALLETRTGEVLDEPMKGTTVTGALVDYRVNGGKSLVRVIYGVGPCKDDDPIAHHSVCIDGNTVYVIPPYTGWIDMDPKFSLAHLYMHNNQPCGMYMTGAPPISVAFDSDTEPISMYRTEREARHAVEEGCKP